MLPITMAVTMKITDLGTVIAQRELGGTLDERPCTVTVKIGKPYPAPDGKDWYCPYGITTPTRERMSYAGGIDAVQALRLAMRKIDAELTLLSNELKLTWCGETDLGFSGFL
jgi:hypothetical protein